MDRIQIKTNAKAQLGNNIFSSWWMNGVLFCLLINLLTGAAAAIPLGAIIFTGAFMYAMNKEFLGLARGSGKIDINNMFSGFADDFAGTLLLWLLMTVFICLWSMLFIIPGIVKGYAYGMAFYIKADHPEYDWKQCLNESKRLTNGFKGDLFVLDLSFFGWYILGMLALGVGILWVMPYHMTARANAYLAITALDSNAAAAPVNTEYAQS